MWHGEPDGLRLVGDDVNLLLAGGDFMVGEEVATIVTDELERLGVGL